jgi:hypothetical protein
MSSKSIKTVSSGFAGLRYKVIVPSTELSITYLKGIILQNEYSPP